MKLYFALGAFIAFGMILNSCNAYRKNNSNEFQVTFNLSHQVDGEALEFDTIRYVNAFGNEYSIVTLRYFISDITLYKKGGESLIFNEAHYVDATENSSLSFSPGMKVPAGKYSALSFIFGLDTLKNITGKYVNPPESKMEWPVGMGGGYHFMKLEGKFHSSGLIKSFQAHSGALMEKPYFIKVMLPHSSFSVDGKDVTIEIIMDINNWWRNPITLDLNDITAIMGDSKKQQQLKENGADVFAVGEIQ